MDLPFVLSQSTYVLSTEDFFSKDGDGTQGAQPNHLPLGLIRCDLPVMRKCWDGNKMQVLQKRRGPLSFCPGEWSSVPHCGKEGGGKWGTEAQ